VTGEPPDERREGEAERRPAARYSLFVGLVFVAVVIIATLNTVLGSEPGILGTDASADRGTPLGQFAVPTLDGPQEGDANVFQTDCAVSANPCPADQQHTPACEISSPDSIRVCDLFDKPLVISFWFMEGADCLPTQDAVDQVARRYRDRVNFLSIDVRDDREQARTAVAERDWIIPVGYDADGAVSNLYRVGGCPTLAFAYPGGILADAKVGADVLSAREIAADVEELIARSARRQDESR
jgi:thiol-disulfide isomerase/thioredoxin